jgi:hypothetical protein
MKIYLEFLGWCAVVGACILMGSGCPQTPTPVVPPPDAADAIAPPPPAVIDATPPVGCDSACAAMQLAGCVVLSDCASTMCRVNTDPRFMHYDVGCLSRAKTVADVRKCGSDCSVVTPMPTATGDAR